VADKKEKEKEKEKKPNAFRKWYHETIGELRKVSWPTMREAWRLTRIVLIVMAAMSAVLGLLDYVFSQLVTLMLG
jgi:preprotein translocase subunit SecE